MRVLGFSVVVIVLIVGALLLALNSGWLGGGPDWEPAITVELHSIRPSEWRPDPMMVEKAVALAGIEPGHVTQAEFFDALTVEGDTRVTVATIPLGPRFSGGSLAVAVGEDRSIRGTGLWGSPEFDEDPTGGWDRFAWQFNDFPVTHPDEADESFDAEAYWSELQADPSAEAELTRLLYELRMSMRDNAYLFRHTWVSTRELGETPDPDWLEGYLERFGRLTEIGVALTPLIGGAAAEQFGKRSAAAADILRQMIEESSAGHVGETGDLLVDKMRAEGCGRCHEIAEHDLGKGPLRDAIRGGMSDHGVRFDLFRTGYDVWALPDDEERSQTHRHATRADLPPREPKTALAKPAVVESPFAQSEGATMRNTSGLAKALSALALLGVIAVGAAALATDATAARPTRPGPLCGPTILFECTFKDGSTELVGLTRCEVDKFEKKNRATCEPATF